MTGHIDLGQIVTSLILLAIGWGVRRTYFMISGFVDNVHENAFVLNDTTEVVDQHSISLVEAGLLKNATIKKLHLGRRSGDPTFIVVDKKAQL